MGDAARGPPTGRGLGATARRTVVCDEGDRLSRLNMIPSSSTRPGPPGPGVPLAPPETDSQARRPAHALIEDAKRSPVRLSDVARSAGCSAATVSRVLNSPESVNRDARLRVEAAVRELGYTRNGAARALRSRRSQMVGVILPTLRQPIYADFIGTLQDGLARQNYALVVTTSDYSPDRELFQARLLVERGIDGLVLVGHTHRPELYELLEIQDLPFLTTYTFWPEFPHPMVGFDNFAAMVRVVDHLHGLGHRDFAMLAGARKDNDRVEQRVAGAVAALAARGIDLPAERIVEEAFTIEGGRRGLARLFDTGNPTALLCSSDVLAYGALIECRARRLDVPGRLSIVGYDSLQSSAHTVPALTSMEIPADEMAQRAAAYILARLAGRSHPARVEIHPRLVVRDTTAPPPAARR